MFTTDSRLFLALAAVTGLAAAIYAGASGDRTGALPLVAIALAAAVTGSLLIGQVVGTAVAVAGTGGDADAAPATSPADGPAPASVWPALSAAAVVLFLIGLVLDVPLLMLGVAVVVVAAGGWVAQAWTESSGHARPDALEAGQRVLGPATLPVLAFLTAAFVIVMMSRILLAVPAEASTAIAIGASVVIMAICAMIALAPRVAARAAPPIVLFVVAGLTVGGIVAAAEGERTIEAHGGAVEIAAEQLVFVPTDLVLHGPGKAVVKFSNRDDAIQHNVAIYEDDSAAEALFVGPVIDGGASTTYVFDAPPPGEYFLRCDVHPDTMTGTVEVSNEEQDHGE
jgi:plastocyanin